MLGGDLRVPLLTLAWPTGEFGPMSLEGAVRLGARRELEALPPEAREARYAELVAQSYAQGRALNVASAFEVDDVVDPADTREVLVRALAGLG
jgi:acetyl-CoA carboxylase carboxyltransferase component